MKSQFPSLLILCGGLAVAAFGCSRKTDANAELEKAASLLANVATTPEAAPAQPSQPNQPAPAPAAASERAPVQQMKQAMAAYQAGQLEDAVTRLQRLRAMPTMTPRQRMAMNDAMAAVMTDIYALAAKGDGRAIQAVKQYEELQTRQR